MYGAAEPPRKDGGELLLSKLFLDACSTVYAVSGGQENQGQAFVSKHFNVIDPLRINNNLGRSVSKGTYLETICFWICACKTIAFNCRLFFFCFWPISSLVWCGKYII